MNKILAALLAAGCCVGFGCSSKDQPAKKDAGGHGAGHDCPLCNAEREAQAKAESAKAAGPLDLVVKDIDGKETDLAAYKGRVVLVVNVASKCGYTTQYDGLQKLYDSKKDQGLVVLGFPSNDFGGQEPGSEAEIKGFCTSKFGVGFPMFSKVNVTGEKASELFKRLSASKIEGSDSPVGAPKWNFTKYLIDRHGVVVAKFDSKVKPDDAKLMDAVAHALSHSHEGEKK